jgi:elongation factor Ts
MAMSFTAQDVKELREKTGAGMMDCKRALENAQGDREKAVDYLRKHGLAEAAKKSSRATREGAIGSYIHAGGKIGVLVEVSCETDFVARTDEFQGLVHDLAMHVAAANPRYVRREDVPAEELAKEREIYLAQARESGKPEKVHAQIAEGKLNKYLAEICLLEQPYVKDPDKRVDQFVAEAVARIKENIQVKRFARFRVGE